MPELEVSKAMTFEAAHYLPEAERPHQRQIHGHSFLLSVTIAGERDAAGRVADLEQLSEDMSAIIAQLDHGLLNEITELNNPTLENLCVWVADQMRDKYGSKLRRISVSRPSLNEVCALRL